MKKLATLFTLSRQEFNHPRTITVCAMMGAAALVLGNFSVYLGPGNRIGFSTIPNMMVAFLFGPVVGSLFNGAMDILKYLMNPSMGAFTPGLTLVTMLTGCIYGCFLYRKPIRLWRVFAAKLTVTLLCNLALNTLCLSFLLGKGFWVLLPGRIAQNVISCPVHAIVFYYVAVVLERAGIFKQRGFYAQR